MSTLDKVLTAPEASEKYRISSQHVGLLLRKNIIRGRMAKGVWLIDEDSLVSYLKARPRPGRKPKQFK